MSSETINALNETGNDPFARLNDAVEFTVTSTSVTDGEQFPLKHYSGAMGVDGEKTSPPSCPGRTHPRAPNHTP